MTADRDDRGFTLLEVLVAMGILAMSLTSLLTSQMQSIRSARYAQIASVAPFLAESKLIDLEWEARQDGWSNADQTFEGSFDEEGWPDVRYTCLVDFIELPEYSELAQAVAEAENETDGNVGSNVQDAGEQAFGVLGMVWPIVKSAIENAIRKASCTVTVPDGKVEHEFVVSTFWVDTTKLDQIPQLGGEATDGGGAGGAGGGAVPGGGKAGGGRTGGSAPSGAGFGGPVTPPSLGGGRRP